jgi:fructoselysine 6-kinase
MSLVAVGDNVTDCYLDKGQIFPGGNCVNVAAQAARLGTRSAYVGVVGDDDRGRLLRDSLAAEGVDVSRLRAVPGDTSLAVVRHIAGDRVFGPVARGVRHFVPSADDLDFISRFQIAHSSYCSDLEAVVPDLAARTRVSFDFDDRVHTAWAEQLLPHVFLAVFSTSHLTPAEAADVLRWAHDRGVRYVLATRGGESALVSDGSRVVSADPVPTRPVDTLGAGDAFVARALHGILTGEPLDVLASAAMEAGSAACGYLGGYGHGAPVSPASLDVIAQLSASPGGAEDPE